MNDPGEWESHLTLPDNRKLLFTPFLFMSQNSILQRRQRSFDCYELKQKWKKVLLFQVSETKV